MKKVRISKNPTRQFSGNFKGNQVTSPWFSGSDPDIEINKTLKPVPEHLANVEAEKDETVMFPKTEAFGDFPSLYNVGGKRHVNGGTNLSLPEDSFVFSDTKDMRIKDKTILAMFGKTIGKKGQKQFTPAELSKKYDINKFLKTLADPDATKVEKATAEQMIKNYQLKLGQLALVQESSKGFPDGIPAVAVPYLYTVGVDPQAILGIPQNQQPAKSPMPGMQTGGGMYNVDDSNVAPENRYQPTTSEQEAIMHKNWFDKTDPNVLKEQKRDWYFPSAQFINERQTRENKQSGGPLIPAHLQGLFNQINTKQQPVTKPKFRVDSQGNILPPESRIDAMSDPERWQHSFTRNQQKLDKQKFGGNLPKAQNGNQGITDFPDDATAEKWNNDLEAYTNFMNAVQSITNNTELIKDLATQFREKTIEDEGSYTGKHKDKWYKDLSSLTDEQIINELLAQEERNARLEAFDFEPSKSSQNAEKNSHTNKEAIEFIKNHKGLEDLKFDTGYRGQAAYIAYKDLMGTDKWKGYAASQTGVGDETVGGKKGKVSGIDNYNTNTTLGQRLGWKGSPKVNIEEKKKDEVGTYDTKSPEYTEQGMVNPDWWQQDVNNLGVSAGNFLGVKKYNPWLQGVDLEEPTPTFISPERALAANAEQANIAQNAIGAFAGPQALSSRQSSIQGTGAKNAADILSQTHNQNVGIANQFELAQKQIRNQETGANAQNAHNFYDQTVIANQNYDNEKNQAEQVMLANYNQGLTNAQMTAAQNAMYPHYQTDPTTGQVYFNRGSKIKPNDDTNPPGMDAYLQKMYELNLEPDPKVIGNFYGAGYTDDADPTRNYGSGPVATYPSMYGKKGGSVMKKVKIKRLPKN